MLVNRDSKTPGRTVKVGREFIGMNLLNKLSLQPWFGTAAKGI
jgi:hypothetical protein